MNEQEWPLRGLTEETKSLLEPLLVMREWPARATIFRESDDCQGLHVMVSGLVKLYRASRTGREQIVHLVREPEALSVTPLFDGKNYPASATTLAKTKTLFLPRADFDHFFRTRPDFAIAMAGELARRVRNTTAITETISLKQVPARVASRIIDNAKTLGAWDDLSTFRMTLSQEELARMLGASRESVARAYAELRRLGLIEQRGSRVRILNPDELSRLAHSDSR
jgi:CRP/FNR family transcriptional regulator